MGFKPCSDIFAISPTLKRSGEINKATAFVIFSHTVTESGDHKLLSVTDVTARGDDIEHINRLRALGCSERLRLSQAVET